MAEELPARAPRSPRRLARLGRLTPFAFGVLVALVAVLLYGVLVPGRAPLTQRDVDETVAEALASVTPPPAFSALVYQAVLPSLVLIQTKRPEREGEPGSGDGLGSGVVVTFQGDILTSLHVIADATEIELTFADGDEVERRDRRRAARERHRGHSRDRTRRQPRARRPRQSRRRPPGQRGLRHGQPLRSGRLDERRRHLRRRSLVQGPRQRRRPPRPDPDRRGGQSGQLRRAVARIATVTSSGSSPPSSIRPRRMSSSASASRYPSMSPAAPPACRRTEPHKGRCEWTSKTARTERRRWSDCSTR